MPPCSPSARWSRPGSTSSPTARSGARATPTASPPRSRAWTSTTRARSSRAAGAMTEVPRIVGKIRRTPASRACATWSSCAATRAMLAKMTLPGPFTMSQQAKNEFYADTEELVMDFAAAVNEEAHDLVAAGRRRHPARRALGAQRPGGGEALCGEGHQPGAARASRSRPLCTCASATPPWCPARRSRAATRSWRSSRTATPSRSRSRRRSRSSISAC